MTVAARNVQDVAKRWKPDIQAVAKRNEEDGEISL